MEVGDIVGDDIPGREMVGLEDAVGLERGEGVSHEFAGDIVAIVEAVLHGFLRGEAQQTGPLSKSPYRRACHQSPLPTAEFAYVAGQVLGVAGRADKHYTAYFGYQIRMV